MEEKKLFSDSFSFLLEIGSFAITIILAIFYSWTAKDLLWSLWISSLTIGYFTILAGIAGNLIHGRMADESGGNGKKHDENSLNPDPKKLQNTGAAMAVFFLLPMAGFFGIFSKITLIYALFVGLSVLLAVIRFKAGHRDESWIVKFFFNLVINFPATVFMLAFFTVHFGGFHFVHSIFLNGFFPLTGDTPFGKSIEGTFSLFFTFITVSFTSYWPFIVTSATSRLGGIVNAVSGKKGDMFLEPYKNVIKMHMMIFIIAFMGGSGLHGYILYATLVIYFFPFSRFFKFKKKTAQPVENP